MLTVAASSIVTQARQAADAETSTPTTDHITDTELYTVLTRANRRLTDIVLAEDGGVELLLTSATLTSPYTLPADFYRAGAVEIPDDQNGTWKALKEFPFRQRNDFNDVSNPRYRIVGGALKLSPASAAPSSIQLWYVPVPADITSSSQVMSVNGWEAYLVAALAEYICVKEDRDPSLHVQARVEALATIRTACKDISYSDTQTIADVTAYPEEYLDLLVY